MSLADFLLARIGEEEGWAHGANRRDSEWPIDKLTGAEIFKARGLMYPVARVLAECDAKRRLIALGEKDSYWDDVLRILALPYADHPDYRNEWRP